MLKGTTLKVYHPEAGLVNFDFEFDKPDNLEITYEFADRGGDSTYRRYGIMSGAYIVDYYVFKLSHRFNRVKPVYILIETNFWSREDTEHEFEIEYNGTKITISAELGEHTHLSVLTRKELNEYLEWLDNLY